MKAQSTILQDLKQYLTIKQLELRPSSYKVYRGFGAKFTKFIESQELKELPTKRVTSSLLQQYRSHILSLHTDPTTRNKEIVQVKMFFNYLCTPVCERFTVSPARYIALVPKQESKLHEPFTIEQVADIFGKILEKKDHYLLL